MMLKFFIVLIIGFVLLIKGADLFVDGSASLARIFKVPGLIIGLTIVALGTSAPELAVSVSAALDGANEIALSNVVGSNMVNILLVLGCCALINPVPVDDPLLRRDFPVELGSTFFTLIAASAGAVLSGHFLSLKMSDEADVISRIEGGILFASFVIYIIFLIRAAKKNPVEETEVETKSKGKCILFILIGIVMIVAGGKAVVYGAENIAISFGMSETLVGLTIVALGTSLPELVTSVVAARKGETAMAFGNVMGSNVFNIMMILGISATIHPITVVAASVYDLCLLFVISVIAYIFSRTGRSITRTEGVIMILLYAAYIAFAIVR